MTRSTELLNNIDRYISMAAVELSDDEYELFITRLHQEVAGLAAALVEDFQEEE